MERLNRRLKDLTETEEIKKRWQKYREELYKKAKWLSEEALQITEKREKQNAKEKRKDIPI